MSQASKHLDISSTEVIVWFIVTVLFVVIQIRYSIVQAGLSVPFTYDDVGYMEDAYIRVKDFYNGNLIHGFFSSPPHSPLATLLCMLGILLFGTTRWGPHLIFGLLTIGVLLFVRYLVSDIPKFWRACAMIFVFTWPITGHFFIDLRPDIMCGFLTVMTIFVVLDSTIAWTRIPQHALLCGMLFSLALLAKPAICPLTFTAVGLSVIARILRDVIEAVGKIRQTSPMIRPIAIVSGIVPIGLLAAPYYIASLGALKDYIRAGMVEQKAIWSLDLPVWDYATYYLFGDGAVFMMGHFWRIACVSLIFLAGSFWFRSRNREDLRSALSIGIVFLYSCLGVTVPAIKTPFLGVIVPCFLLLGSIKAYRYCVNQYVSEGETSKKTRQRLAYCCTVLFFAVLLHNGALTWEWVNRTGSYSIDKPNAQFLNQRLDAVVARLLDYRGLAKVGEVKTPIVFIGSPDPMLNADNIRLELLKKEQMVGERATDFTLTEVTLSDDMNRLRAGVDAADIIVAFSEDDPGAIRLNTLVDRRHDVLEYICHSGKFALDAVLFRPFSTGRTYVFFREGNHSPALSKREHASVCEGYFKN